MKFGKLINVKIKKHTPKYLIGKRWSHKGYQNTLKAEQENTAYYKV